MTQYKDIVEDRKLQITKHKDHWYIHVHNKAGYTEVLKEEHLTTTFRDKRKKPIIEKVEEI